MRNPAMPKQTTAPLKTTPELMVSIAEGQYPGYVFELFPVERMNEKRNKEIKLLL
jgi:hypothetical protein